MSKKTEERLNELDRKARIPWNSMKDRDVLLQEMQSISKELEQSTSSLEELNKVSLITISIFTRGYEFISKVANGEKQVDDDELKGLEKSLKDLSENVKGFEEQAKVYEIYGLKAAANSYREMAKVAEGDYRLVLTNAIQKEKLRRQNSPDIPTPPPSSPPSPKDNGRGNSPSSPSSNNTALDKEITNLKNQVKVLEDKLKNTPSSDTSLQSQYRREIQRIQTQLKEKEKEKEKEVQSKKGDFPTGLVIGGGVVIVIVLLALFFLLGRSSKNK